jgi:hypothetical protein
VPAFGLTLGDFLEGNTCLTLCPDVGLAKEEKFADLLAVGSDDEVAVLQIALLLLTFLGQDVAVISVMTLDLTRSGEHESLLCCGISLYFWHFFVLFKLLFNEWRGNAYTGRSAQPFSIV